MITSGPNSVSLPARGWVGLSPPRSQDRRAERSRAAATVAGASATRPAARGRSSVRFISRHYTANAPRVPSVRDLLPLAQVQAGDDDRADDHAEDRRDQ